MICSIVLRISRTRICSKRLYGLLRHGKNQLEEGCIVRRQFVKVIDFLEGERSRFPGKRTAENDGEGRMGNDHLSRRSSPTASTSFHPAGLGKSMGHETHTKNHEKTTWLGTSTHEAELNMVLCRVRRDKAYGSERQRGKVV